MSWVGFGGLDVELIRAPSCPCVEAALMARTQVSPIAMPRDARTNRVILIFWIGAGLTLCSSMHFRSYDPRIYLP